MLEVLNKMGAGTGTGGDYIMGINDGNIWTNKGETFSDKSARKEFKLTQEEYAKWGNEQTFLVVQIETPQALDSIEEIAGIPGIDILLLKLLMNTREQ